VVRRLVDEVMNAGRLDVLDELYDPRLAPAARRWVEPFLTSFADVRMRIVELVTEGETVVGRLACSGTHTGAWLGHPPTGRRFTDVAEVYFFRVVDGRITRPGGSRTH
jgi:predicted ester cyclase